MGMLTVCAHWLQAESMKALTRGREAGVCACAVHHICSKFCSCFLIGELEVSLFFFCCCCGSVVMVLGCWHGRRGFNPGCGNRISMQAKCQGPAYPAMSMNIKQLQVVEIIQSTPPRRPSLSESLCDVKAHKPNQTSCSVFSFNAIAIKASFSIKSRIRPSRICPCHKNALLVETDPVTSRRHPSLIPYWLTESLRPRDVIMIKFIICGGSGHVTSARSTKGNLPTVAGVS